MQCRELQKNLEKERDEWKTNFKEQQTTFTYALIQIRDAYTKGNDKNVHEAQAPQFHHQYPQPQPR